MKCKQTCSLAEKSHSSLLRGHVASCCKTQRRDCYSQFTANGASNPFSSWQVILSMMRITIHPFPIDWTIFHPKVEPQDVGKLLGRSKPLPWDTTQLTSHCLTDWQLTDRQTTGTKPCGCQCRGISLLVRRFGSKQSHTQANNTNNKFPWSWSCFLGFTFFGPNNPLHTYTKPPEGPGGSTLLCTLAKNRVAQPKKPNFRVTAKKETVVFFEVVNEWRMCEWNGGWVRSVNGYLHHVCSCSLFVCCCN